MIVGVESDNNKGKITFNNRERREKLLIAIEKQHNGPAAKKKRSYSQLPKLAKLPQKPWDKTGVDDLPFQAMNNMSISVAELNNQETSNAQESQSLSSNGSRPNWDSDFHHYLLKPTVNVRRSQGGIVPEVLTEKQKEKRAGWNQYGLYHLERKRPFLLPPITSTSKDSVFKM